MFRLNICRLCFKDSAEFIYLYNALGQKTEIFKQAVKYFDPTFLSITPANAVICLDCYDRIHNFHTYQQSVFEAHKNILETQSNLLNIQTQDNLLPPEVLEIEEITTTEYNEQYGSQNRLQNLNDENIDMNLFTTIVKHGENSNNLTVDLLSVNNSNTEILEHSRVDTQIFRCNVCLRAYSSQKLLVHHMLYKHSRVHKNNDTKMNVTCYVCKISFTSFNRLRQHFLEEHTQMVFYVICCQRKIYRRNLYEAHARLHSEANAYSCEICRKIMPRQESLQLHMLSNHTNLKSVETMQAE